MNHTLLVAIIVVGVLIFLSVLALVFTGGITNKSITGCITNIENLPEHNGSILYFQDDTILKCYNKFPDEVNIEYGKQYTVTYKEIKGGLIMPKRIYLDKLYLVK